MSDAAEKMLKTLINVRDNVRDDSPKMWQEVYEAIEAGEKAVRGYSAKKIVGEITALL